MGKIKELLTKQQEEARLKARKLFKRRKINARSSRRRNGRTGKSQ